MDYKKEYQTYRVIPELKEFTKLTKGEQIFNQELKTFPINSQKRVLATMKVLIGDELAYVLSVENYKRDVARNK